ncbi:probable E3 ubiquitin-protein ligase HERC4 isoform X2 [Sitodiplosis mosellana]|uniref:probable E3 ubiquitin-protein ligase HERC4 isoform X2 n=1 Tax=Sitodiplosis mosellana TaxID=263140 RepID=UPI002443AF62|nr:probable E3 ubiquitin-protein ligase HERC4 isoform X2 [Sitodiplosis mosellana]
MTLYCWGSTSHGELALGGIEEEHVLTPRQLDWSLACDIEHVSCGPVHTLFLVNGKVYSSGNNDFGQLGHEQTRKRPHLVENLESHVIKNVCCGSSHSCAINEWGLLFTWGSNSFGQLGYGEFDTNEPLPKLAKKLATKNIVQIACGDHHNLALTNEGELWSWGLNNYGQLGIGNAMKKVTNPMKITSLDGIPIAFIACGGYHSFAISKSGAVFGWGKNTFGQLGIGDENPRFYPTQLKTLRSIGVRKVSAGEDFSVFLTLDGGVFSCGAGNFGQLGHGNRNNVSLPRMVVEMMGTQVTQVTCGNRHTLTYVPSRGRIYGFGLNSCGQLGNRSTNNSAVPIVVIGPWAFDDKTERESSFVKRIFSGGDRSFAFTSSDNTNSYDSRILESNTQIESLSISLAKHCASIGKDETVDLQLMSSIETLFRSLACINGSFLQPNDAHMCCTSKNHGVNIADAEIAFGYIRKMENLNLKNVIWEGITTTIIKTLSSSPPDVEVLRSYLLLPLYHEFINSKNYETLHTPFSRAVLSLGKIPLNILTQWWAEQSTDYFERLVENYKSVVMHVLRFKYNSSSSNMDTAEPELPMVTWEPNLDMALKMLKLLFQINNNQRMQRLSYETFYLPEITEMVDLQKDFYRWSQSQGHSNEFFLCNFPFIFDAKSKTLLLQTDQAIQMHRAVMQAQQSLLLANLLAREPTDVNEFVVFNVTRENIVNDTIREICMCNVKDLKKPLKVKFLGEEGEDAGGVRKEFFLLLMKEILDQKYGMFQEYEESRLIWFASNSFEDPEMYKLVGTICGLAIYNFIIINLPFPLALYKKLLKEKVDLTDMKEVSPVLGRTMQNILNYEGNDMEDVFDLTFEISRENYGHLETVPLKPNGDQIRVNQENKKEFVELYIDFVLNKSVETQFNAFYAGFMKVCGGPVMELFRSHELMGLIIGNEHYDWDAFEQSTKYKGGYSSGDPTIRLFWEVFHELPLEDKKKFLLFLTGSDRIAIGTKALQIIIQPVTDDKFLPVAHTCFNLLDLPRYQTKEKLKYKLMQAIQQHQGFSLV